MTAVRIIPFAAARDAVGGHDFDLELEGAATAAAVLDLVCARFPALAQRRASLQLAVNNVWADPGTPVAPGDEVALLPPVSGG